MLIVVDIDRWGGGGEVWSIVLWGILDVWERNWLFFQWSNRRHKWLSNIPQLEGYISNHPPIPISNLFYQVSLKLNMKLKWKNSSVVCSHILANWSDNEGKIKVWAKIFALLTLSWIVFGRLVF